MSVEFRMSSHEKVVDNGLPVSLNCVFLALLYLTAAMQSALGSNHHLDLYPCIV